MDKENKEKKQLGVMDYKVGMSIYGVKIKKIYFANKTNAFIIIKSEKDNNIHVFGGDLSKIENMIAECKYLVESLRVAGKDREMFDYQRAIAINTFLLGQEENSKKILENLIENLKKRKILYKKLWYIGIFFLATIIMMGCSLAYKDTEYGKYLKIAMFGSIGGFISLNIRLKKIKFDISDSTISYIVVSLYKVMFSMLTSIIVYFLIEGDFILGIAKNETSNQMYFLYIVSTLAGFSESLLPNIFKGIEEKTRNL